MPAGQGAGPADRCRWPLSGNFAERIAIESIAHKIGCVPQTLNEWVRREEIDTGARAGVTTTDLQRLKELERENKELRKANEILNADEGQGHALRGCQFGELQEYLQTMSSVVVDMGASNVEELMGQMQRDRDSHEDFHGFMVPTVPALKQQQDTIATLIAQAKGTTEKVALAQKLATRRLACGVVPGLDARFAALEFKP